MATVCRICKTPKGRSHKMSCNFSKYNQPVEWVNSFTNTIVATDSGSGFGYYDSSPSCDTGSSSSYDSGSSSSCDSGSF